MKVCARFVLSWGVLLLLQAATWGESSKVLINEFLASNLAGIKDPEFGEFSDWIELHNAASRLVSLSGCYLTDDWDEPQKWQIPEGTVIPGNGFLLLWADGRNTGLHTNFKLDKAGEQLGLYTRDGVALDTLAFGAQQDDVSYGRLGNDPNHWAFLRPASPGSANGSQASVPMTAPPVFSLPGGFYGTAQVLSFTNADQMEIYYSLDGTSPNDKSLRYLAPLVLGTTTAVRAIGYTHGCAPSAVVTQTYFIAEAVHLPFISIVTDPANFFSNERGIYVTGTNGTGGYCDDAIRNVKQDWERPVNVELYEVDGTCGFNQRAGVKIFGGCSRTRFPVKSLALYARKEYGQGAFQYQLFPDKDIDHFESFILRSSGDDQVLTLFRDALSQMVLVEYMDVDVQDYRPVVLFLNGQYWGIHNLREKISEHYAAENFGIDEDQVNLLEGSGGVIAGTEAGYAAMVNYANTHDMADPLSYEVVRAQIDIDQYIDYMIGHIYSAATDWPGNNIKFWRATSGPLARWRWINFDMDQSYMTYRVNEDMMTMTTTTTGPSWPNPEWSTRLFRNLLKNEGFRNEFIQRFAYHMNTTFHPERLVAFIDHFQERLAPEIPRHITKWGGKKDPDARETWMSPIFSSVAQWKQNVDQMRVFARTRPTPATQHMLKYFGLSGTSQITLGLHVPDSAVLQINGKQLRDGFQGTYFNDAPVVVRATPKLGYSFSYWETRAPVISAQSLVPAGAVWKYSDRGQDLGTAWQQIGYDDVRWGSGPAQLGYGDGDEATVVGYGGVSGDKYITTYFRKSFTLTSVPPFRSLAFSLLVNDGAVAYLNGQEIARLNLPAGRITYTTLASLGTATENTFTKFSVPPTYLRSGVNILAVEVHQTSNRSPDISFDCSLAGETVGMVQTNRTDSPQITITLSDAAQLTAFLEADPKTIADPIVITEINYKSAPEADSDDWVELYNRTPTAIDLTNWKFADGAGHAYEFASGTILWPQSYLILCRDKIKFKGAHPYVKNRLGNLPFGLSSEGESLRVIDSQNRIVDRVDYATVAPWPQTAQGTGYTIELLDVSSDNSRSENWRALTPYGTPGRGHE